MSTTELVAIKPTAQTPSFTEFFNHTHKLVKNQLEAFIKHPPSPCLKLQRALEYTALTNGKLFRPMLVYAVNPDNKHANLLLNSACAIELVHTYSLVHDDLPAMDNDDIRRGKPSCHKRFDEATAILVGDSLQSLAFNIITNATTSDNNKIIQIIRILSQAIGNLGMVAGQSLELSGQASTVAQLDTVHQLKTGKLFTACLQIGAICADLDNNQQQWQLLTTISQNLGLAFQIQDDILDYTQTSDKLGKPALSDDKRNLTTYSNIIGIKKASQTMDALWSKTNNLIEKLNWDTFYLKSLINKIKAREY